MNNIFPLISAHSSSAYLILKFYSVALIGEHRLKNGDAYFILNQEKSFL